MTDKKKKSSTTKQVKEDIKKLSEDWEQLKAQEELSHDPQFLGTLAGDIINLESDCLEFDEEYEAAELAHHFVSTPWGAPFASNLTLFDAALSLQHQRAEDSDLAHLMEDFHLYGHQFENQFLKVFEEQLEDI
ncbi:MAG: hypothetical protein ChlgKO_08460 [Chlamydiales bacterium]